MLPRPSSRTLLTSALLAALLASAPVAPPARAADPAARREVDRAVDRALANLARKQRDDGGWGAGRNAGGGNSPAITSLVVLAFMARGHIPGQGDYGEALNKAIDSVLAAQKSNGFIAARDELNHGMYHHGISTVMLSQAHSMVSGKTVSGQDRAAAVDAALAKAVRFILDSQARPKAVGSQGGWRYTPDSADADISVSGWQLMALRGAANAGAPIPKSALDDGIAYIISLRRPSGGFVYSGELGESPARTGTGVLALQLLGKRDSREAVDGGQYILRAIQTKHNGGLDSMFFYYAVYYCSQAAFQLGGKYDEQINANIRKTLLELQQPNGNWTTTGVTAEVGAGDTYATAMAVLALSVQYHYLPLYQR